MVAQHVTVSGIDMELGDALRQHVRTEMAALGGKYFGRLVTCRVAFRRRAKGHGFACGIQVVVGRDMRYVSAAESDQAHACFRHAREHLAKQLRRQKRALHEDKPSGRGKERALDEMSQPEPAGDGVLRLPIDGGELSILDGGDASAVVQRMYGATLPR